MLGGFWATARFVRQAVVATRVTSVRRKRTMILVQVVLLVAVVMG
jgi:hypothetical protein